MKGFFSYLYALFIAYSLKFSVFFSVLFIFSILFFYLPSTFLIIHMFLSLFISPSLTVLISPSLYFAPSLSSRSFFLLLFSFSLSLSLSLPQVSRNVSLFKSIGNIKFVFPDNSMVRNTMILMSYSSWWFTRWQDCQGLSILWTEVKFNFLINI